MSKFTCNTALITGASAGIGPGPKKKELSHDCL
jgi:NADP-dependent 3-hydroxy acid dehydrogenase YdfG